MNTSVEGDFVIFPRAFKDEFLEYHGCFDHLYRIERVYYNEKDGEWRVSLLNVSGGRGLNTYLSGLIIIPQSEVRKVLET